MRKMIREDLQKVWSLIEDKGFRLSLERLEEIYDQAEEKIICGQPEIGFGFLVYRFEEDSKKIYDILVYVAEDKRRMGYGRSLVRTLEETLHGQEDICYRIDNMLTFEDSKAAIEALGYEMFYSSSLMIFKGKRFPDQDLSLEAYGDQDYEIYTDLLDEAFYQVSIDNNMTPNNSRDIPGLRQYLMDVKDEIKVIREGDILGAVLQVSKDHIGRVMVASHLRGKGLGRSLVQDGTNQILDQGLEPKLYIMDTNQGARRLYESLGYELESTVHVYRRFI